MRWFALVVPILLLSGCVYLQASPEKKGSEQIYGGNFIITIENFSFNPDHVKVYRGTRITWVNRDDVVHTVDGGRFSSGEIEPGGSYSVLFDEVGTYPYRCTIHPTMTGVIEVV